MYRSIILLALLLTMGFGAASQEKVALRGRILDSQSREPIPYATLQLQGSSTGTQSNDQGEYTLKLSSSDGAVVFSAIGYKRQVVSIKQLIKSGTVRMQSQGLQLREVEVVNYRSPQSLIAAAVQRIPRNYHVDTTVGTWFVRDWRMLDSALYLFDESVVDMLRYGYTAHDDKRYYTQSTYRREMDDNYKAVRKHRLLIHDSVPLRLASSGDNATNGLQYSDNTAFYDLLATPEASKFTAQRILKRYHFKPIQEYTDDIGETYYLLQATNRKDNFHYTWRIRKSDLSIVELTGYTDSSTTTFKPSTWSVQPYAAVRNNGNHYTYRYAEREGRMTMVYFSAFQDNTYFSHRMYGHEHDAAEQHFISRREWLLTDLRPGDTTFLATNTVQSHRPQDMQTAFGESLYSDDYWEQYNTLPLDADIAARLQAQLATRSTSLDDIVQPIQSLAQLDSLTALRDTATMTMPPLPRWTLFRYGGIGGNRLYGSEAKSRGGFSQQLGLGASLRIDERFHLRADLQYAWLTTKTDHGRFNSHNLTLPLRADFDLLRETPRTPMRLYLSVGGWGRYALLGRLGSDWQTIGRDYDRTDYGWSWGIGMEMLRQFFLEYTAFYSLHPLPINDFAPKMRRRNWGITLGINF